MNRGSLVPNLMLKVASREWIKSVLTVSIWERKRGERQLQDNEKDLNAINLKLNQHITQVYTVIYLLFILLFFLNFGQCHSQKNEISPSQMCKVASASRHPPKMSSSTKCLLLLESTNPSATHPSNLFQLEFCLMNKKEKRKKGKVDNPIAALNSQNANFNFNLVITWQFLASKC